MEEGIFAYCTSLENIISQGKIVYILDNAFYGCSNLLQVPLSEAVHIGENAFSGCKKLDYVNINCTSIQANAFRNTAFLDKMRNLSPLVIISNTVVDGKHCTKDVIIPEGVVSIAPYAFVGNHNINSILFPRSLETIGDGAFSGCKNVKEIYIPPLIKYIGKKVFEKCVSLTNVLGNVEDIGEGTFSYCVNLKNVNLKEVVSLGKDAFCGCEVLEVCQFKELQYISESCFSECTSLKDFDFSNIKFIGKSAFSGCNSIKSISLNTDTYVDSHAFEDCGSLEKVILSDETMRQGSYAFSGCTALKVIEIGEKKYIMDQYTSVFEKQIPDIVKSIYNSVISCFDIDENLSLSRYRNKGFSICIPKGIKTIEREVFKDSMNLEEVYIPESVEYIGERAFDNTMWLEKQSVISPMVIVNNILIHAYLCQGEVIIPDYVKRVSGWAFANCYEITKVTFSCSRTIAEEYAFRNCINLKKVITADGKEYRLTKISDRNDDMLPSSVKQIFMDCLNCFKTDENDVLVECTGNIVNLILPEGITAIGDGGFQNSNLLTHITLTKDTVSIGKSAFEQ